MCRDENVCQRLQPKFNLRSYYRIFIDIVHCALNICIPLMYCLLSWQFTITVSKNPLCIWTNKT